MDRSASFVLLFAGLAGMSAVGLGAFGAHGLEDVLTERGSTGTWETAVLYHVVHTLGLLALGLAPVGGPRPWVAAWAWAVGLVLFCGSLYGLALGGPGWLGPVTPFGGVAFLIGWGSVAWTGLRGRATLP